MRPAPEVQHPGDVAALRLWLLDALSDGRPIADAYNYVDKDMTHRQHASGRMRVPGTRPASQWWSQEVLPDASLYYFGDDVVDLMQEVAHTVPDVELTTELVPVKHGFLVFAKTWWGKGSDGTNVPVDAIVWGPTVVPTDPRMPALSMRSAISVGLLTRQGGFWIPIGRTDWILGWERSAHSTIDYTVITETGEADSLDQDRCIALAAWTIIMQPGLSTQHEERSKAGEQAHRRTARKQDRKKQSPPVRVIYLPERHYSGEATGTGTKLDHRVYVAPFWRQQPYGPHSSLRRPVLVRGHIRGPEGTPLVRRDVVRAKITP